MDRVQIIATVINGIRGWVRQPGTRSYVSWKYSLGAFEAPTQAVTFQLRSPDVAFVFFTHREDSGEMECQYEGPLAFSEALEVLPKALEKFRQVEVATAVNLVGCKTLAEVMESSFLQFFTQMGPALYKIGAGTLLFHPLVRVAILIIPGTFDSQDPNLIVESVKAQLDTANSEPLEHEKYFDAGKAEREIHWASFVPPTRIGETESKSFQQSVIEGWQRDPSVEPSGPIWKSVYGSTPIIVFASGIVVADNTNKLESLQAINTFFGACTFAGQLCAPTTPHELYEMSITPFGCISSYSGPNAYVGRALPRNTRTFGLNNLEKALKIVARVSRDEGLALRLRLGNASKTHFMAGEYLQGFSLAWTAVEMSITEMWKRFLAGGQIGGKRLQQLTESDHFTAFVIIEVLNLCGQLSAERHSRLQRLRRVRNDVHARRPGAVIPGRR